ncbi:MAG: DUF3422 domain-containing protein [Pseudomonadota bacterium]
MLDNASMRLEDHPLRYELANELHARPFPSLKAPAHAAFLAIKSVGDAASRDRAQDRAHLVSLLDRFGAQHPSPGATHFFADLGPFRLKWECHTEFVTYTVFVDGTAERPFDHRAFDVFPADWLAEAPGKRLTSALIRVETMGKDHPIKEKLQDWFVNESLAVSEILDGSGVLAGDFRIDPAGHVRFGVFVDPAVSERRVGRIVQRICEIETYKSMSMLGFHRARSLSSQLGTLDAQLEMLTGAMAARAEDAEETLKALLSISAELESLLAKANFRFSATRAYEAIVLERISVLKEAQFNGRQSFKDFMARRFDPAMRTVQATEKRLLSMAERAARAGNLLRTRVDVERSAQNQDLLESMDRRSDMQLRLQKTVEGFSVVAISYYALNLASYLLAPSAEAMGWSKAWLTTVLVLPVIAAVWWLIRRIRRGLE